MTSIVDQKRIAELEGKVASLTQALMEQQLRTFQLLNEVQGRLAALEARRERKAA